MKKKNLKSLFDFAQENNTAEMDEMLRVSLKGGGLEVGGVDSRAGYTLEDSDGCLKTCTGSALDSDIDGD